MENLQLPVFVENVPQIYLASAVYVLNKGYSPQITAYTLSFTIRWNNQFLLDHWYERETLVL